MDAGCLLHSINRWFHNSERFFFGCFHSCLTYLYIPIFLASVVITMTKFRQATPTSFAKLGRVIWFINVLCSQDMKVLKNSDKKQEEWEFWKSKLLSKRCRGADDSPAQRIAPNRHSRWKISVRSDYTWHNWNLDEKSIVRNALGKGEPTEDQQAIVLWFTQRRRGNRSIWRCCTFENNWKELRSAPITRMLATGCSEPLFTGSAFGSWARSGKQTKGRGFHSDWRGKVSFDKARMYDS